MTPDAIELYHGRQWLIFNRILHAKSIEYKGKTYYNIGQSSDGLSTLYSEAQGRYWEGS